MRRKSVVIVGVSGFVGIHLAQRLRDEYKVSGTYHSHPIQIPGVSTFPMNALDRDGVKRVMYTLQPTAIVYCVGDNRPEWVEENFREAERYHAGGVATVAGATDVLQAKMIVLSNSYVFDGRKGNYHESDTVLPSGALGKCKLGAENFVRGKSLNYAILRTGPLLGRGTVYRPSWIDRMRVTLSRGQSLDLSDHEIQSYLPVQQLAELVSRTIDGGIKNRAIHLGGATKISPYKFGLEFARRFGFSESLLRIRGPSESAAKKGPRRSHGDEIMDYSLNSSFVLENLKIKPLLLKECLDLLEKDLVAGSRSV